MRSHDTGSHLEVFLRNAVPIGGAWVVTAQTLRTYRPPWLVALLRTWIIAVGVALRSWWVGSPTGNRMVVFSVVALGFTLALLVLGRLVAMVLERRRSADDVRT